MIKVTDYEIINRFERLGLSNYEARVYIFLLRNGQSYGNEVSKNTGIPGSKIYETLSRLVEKGLAHLIQGKQVYYQALPLKEFLDQWKTDANRIVEYIEDNKELIEIAPQGDLLWHLSGRKQLIEKMKEFIDSAEDNILISLWPDESKEIENNLRQAHNRKVRITSIQFGEISLNIGNVHKHINTASVEERHGSELFLLVDSNKGMFMYHESPRGWIGYYSSSKGMARVIENYIRHDIYINKIINDHYEVAINSYGDDLSKLIDLY